MADEHSKEVRSKNTSHIHSKNSKPEEIVRKHLFAQGFDYHKNARKQPACPDIVLPKYHAVVFVDGYFWNKHNCDRFARSESNVDYWKPKFHGNVERNKRYTTLLVSAGWNVIVLWECELNRAIVLERYLQFCSEIRGGNTYGTNEP